jgi:hypothetical protein
VEGARMKVFIKDLQVSMEVKNVGIELDVSDNEGHKGDLFITKTQLIWCPGKTQRENGVPMRWQEFIKYMEDRPK